MSGEFVTITSDEGLTVRPLLGENSATMIGGFGGWEVIDRPRRVGLTRFKGKDPFRMDIPIIFDGYLDSNSQEIPIATLARMAEIPDVGLEPSTVTVDGAVPRDDLTWVIEGIDWDNANVIWDMQSGTPVRLRQAATVHLLQFVDDDVIITAPTPAVQAGKGGSGGGKTVTSDGSNLKDVAKAQFGDPNLWSFILSVNPWIKDPRSPLPPGQPIVIPAKPTP